MDAVSERGVIPPMADKDSIERRSQGRFGIRDGAVASLQLTVIGKIMNISHGGLAFQYVASRERSRESSRLSISLTDRTFNLGMIHFKVVWDSAMPQSFSSGPISLRHCGGEFRTLEDYQMLALQFFMEKYSVPVLQPGRVRCRLF